MEIYSIEPEGGPVTGGTSVVVRGDPFKDMYLVYPSPKCRFGRKNMIVNAHYISCLEKPTLAT